MGLAVGGGGGQQELAEGFDWEVEKKMNSFCSLEVLVVFFFRAH